MLDKEKRKGTPTHTKRFLIIGILIGVALTSVVTGLSAFLIQNTATIEDDTAITTWLNLSPEDGKAQVQDIAIAPNKQSIATLYTVGDSSGVVVHSFDAITGLPTKQVARLQADGVYRDVAWSSNSQRILVASDDDEDNGIVRSIRFDGSEWTFAGNFMAVASENGLLAVNNGGAITFYDSTNGQLISSIEVDSPATHIALSPDAQWLTYVINYNDPDNGDHYVVTTTPRSQDQTTPPVQSNRVWHHHHLDVLSVPQGDRLILWNAEQSLVLHNIELAGANFAKSFDDDVIHGVAVAGYRLAVALNDRIRLYQYQQREGWTTLQWVDDGSILLEAATHLTFTPDGQYLYAVVGEQMVLRDLASGTTVAQWRLLAEG